MTQILKHPVVSVWVLTYNHAGYISKCLDSILEQDTEYSFEICIGEDESTDGTREICQAYAKKYPGTIRLFLRDRNDPAREGCCGAWQFNFIETFKACHGQFVAMCDGDDYWSDKRKIQKQVDFLKQHPNCSGCYHKIGQVDENGLLISADMGYPPRRQEFYSLDYLLEYSNFSPMFSVVFRNHENVAPDWIRQAPFGDMIVHTGNLLRGDYGFIDEVMGFYRIHSGGLASGTSRADNVRATLEVYSMIGDYMSLKGSPSYRKGVRNLRFSLFAEKLLSALLPVSIKRKFDLVLGKRIRAKVRRMLSFISQ
jgi:glycosyltransferase involved in cell wall biosynthesis